VSLVFAERVNPSKVFLTQKIEVTSRWDPFYFRPELVTLEKRVRKVTPYRLRDFVVQMAGGATPSTTEADKHYTESKEGVPFIRVQNLSTTGRLNLEDCKQITRSTHEGLLRRSRLFGGELLVKITGVGRMAVASVVPNDFEGNINQHIVAIRTENAKTSETLAAYLNLDIAERLASRRSTGGTRPAPDYPALLSIPVIFDERVPKLFNAAVIHSETKRAKAKALLAQIDDALLDELGIRPKPELPSTIENRTFRRAYSEVTGDRFDPHYHRPSFKQLSATLRERGHLRLGDVVKLSHELWDQASLFQSEFPYLEIGAINMDLGRFSAPSFTLIAEAASRARMLVRPTDLLVSLTRPTRRAIAFPPKNLELAVASNGFAVIRDIDFTAVTPRYLFHVLRSYLCTAQFDQRSSGGNYPAITEEQLLKLIIPLPTKKTPTQVADMLDGQYARAEAILVEAEQALHRAKQEIEALILGQEGTT